MIPDDPASQAPDSEHERQLPDGASRISVTRRGPAYEWVRARLRSEGRLTFAAFMAEALYGTDGYYTRRPRLGGAAADFFTSPELHPAFGALLGRMAAGVWDQLDRPAHFEIVEHGPGTGALCRDLLTWADHVVPTFGRAIGYRLVESSPSLQGVQRDTLAAAGLADEPVMWAPVRSPQPGLSHGSCQGAGGMTQRCSPRSEPERWVGGALGMKEPHGGLGRTTGLILANELVDALPVHLVEMRHGELRERYVVLDESGGLGWREDEPSTLELARYFERLGVWPGEGCVAEVNLGGVAWMEQTAATLERGALLVLDYGYPAAELYAASRRYGTLLTYRKHTLGSDPLLHVGEQDITAHVDFTSLARAGERGGLVTVGLISQSALLRQLGLDRLLRQLERTLLPAGEYDANRRALQALVDLDRLGRVQALLQTCGLPEFDPFAITSKLPVVEDDPNWLPLLHAGQMRLPGPLDAEGFFDLDAQWSELISDGDQACDSDDST